MNTRILLGALAGVIVGFIGGSYISSPEFLIPKVDTHTAATSSMMHHTATEVLADSAIPSIEVSAIKDAKDGYNIHIVTKNFRWAPEAVNTQVVQGEGHAHVYINGVKIARVYGEWLHISSESLQEGTNVIEVTLNANDHSEWVVGGEHIADTVTVRK